jgi:hypothetical protein
MKTLFATLAAALLSVLAFVALRHGWADFLAFQGRALIRTWDSERRTYSTDDWAVAQSRLENALDLNPGDPGVAEDLGRLHELRALNGVASTAELHRALHYFRIGAVARPTSPYTWANIAFTQSRIGILDANFYRAIENAAFLGPWEPEVQLALADIGFRYWDRVPQATRTTIHQAMRRGLKRQDKKLFELAAGYRRLDVMCATPEVYRSKLALRCV